MSTYDPSRYEERQAANDRSRRWALRDGLPWSAEDDEFLWTFWMDPLTRDERAVSVHLQRTIEACRNRAHFLRGVKTGARYNKDGRPEEQPALCPGCWVVLPLSGRCDTCVEG